MVYSEIIENVHIELVLHTDCKNKVISSKVQLVTMATTSDKLNINGRAEARKFPIFSLFWTSITHHQGDNVNKTLYV